MDTIGSPVSASSIKKDSLTFLKSLFNSTEDDVVDSQAAPLPFLSPLANSVISSCSKILQKPTEELQHCFDTEHPNIMKESLVYARSFLEFCSYQALNLMTRRPDYLADKNFRRLTFDMMLAWDGPSAENELNILQETASCSNQEVEDEEGWSLFYSNSTNMAAQVDEDKTVGLEAFARIAPACTVIADVITVHNLFDVLTMSSGHKLHFLIYDKYLRSLEKVIKSAANVNTSSSASNLQLAEGEIILEIDGTVPTQPIFQHIGISGWPGRLTLTNNAMYFESMGVGLYDKAVKFELAADMKQVIKPDLTGPLGARLYDKAVMYKSTSITEPVYFEFTEFKGSSRRDYWLDISLEILYAHKFIRMYNLKKFQQLEALARAALGILRYRAVKEAFQNFPSNYKTLLCFNLAESLPGGYTILQALSSRLSLLDDSSSQHDSVRSPRANRQLRQPISYLTLCRHKIVSIDEVGMDKEEMQQIGDVCVGEINPLEMAVKQSKQDIGRAEAAQATVDQVKVEGIDTNIAIMQELLFPLIESFNHLQRLASWEEPSKSTVFLVLVTYVILGGWMKYVLPSIFIFVAIMMGCNRFANYGKPLEAFNITAPPYRNAVEQLLALQEAISELEALIQAGNIFLLKIRALLFAALPQATDRIAILLVILAVVFAFVPVQYLILLAFYEAYTREMPLRKDSSDQVLRRMREWWYNIPAAPVQLIKPDDKKTK
ncbi:hypothetical protein DCAR_0935236 [Daucus carota subsp. sativus]|uniref:DUF639 domain-containing protein n=1 Tax=Daucus carota subsp. sativus TaxID=79200 RepID=A0A175YHU2_DAUCS|nr:PREDICTED: uncharacterized protein LOC108202633 isoform X1 [Daucus carota subsp. sativus]WOH15693.1 hypothetical protein DCAR_0935236 [Daucus carota subsp. sativus]